MRIGEAELQLNDSGIQEDTSFTEDSSVASSPSSSIVEIYCFEELNSFNSPRGIKRSEETCCYAYAHSSCKKLRADEIERPDSALDLIHDSDVTLVSCDVGGGPELQLWSPLLDGDLHSCINTTTTTKQQVTQRRVSNSEENTGFEEHEMDIYLHRRKLELQFHPLNCLNSQPQITPGMRAVLIEWLTTIHHQLQLYRETLFLTVNIIDRFLSITPISRDCFQLLGVTALLVASKQEEVFPPEIVDLLRMCRDTYSREQVKQLERIVLCRLQFDLMVPTSQYFLEHYASARIHMASMTGCTVKQIKESRAIARYLLELALQDYGLCQFAPTLLALASLEVADDIHSRHARYGAMYYGGYSREALHDCVTEMQLLATVLVQNNPDLDWVYEKYTEISDFPTRPS